MEGFRSGDSIDLMVYFCLCVFEKLIYIDVDCGFRVFSDIYGLFVADSFVYGVQ